jgi:hypothetical protein
MNVDPWIQILKRFPTTATKYIHNAWELLSWRPLGKRMACTLNPYLVTVMAFPKCYDAYVCYRYQS